jgi:H+/Cl- antiporter ClcA
MFHLIWYIIVGLIAGFVAKPVMHMHLTLLWTRRPEKPVIKGGIFGPNYG